MQRFFDILLSSIAIIFLLPILIPIVLILKFTGEGEIFYVQDRVGRGGKVFGLLKFATMLKNSLNMGSKDITLRNDPRVLPFGKLLRATKLNELPQLLNILKGDMSFIGPRPMLRETYDLYDESVKKKIEKVQPGLSGIGSVVFRDEEELLSKIDTNQDEFYNSTILPYKGELEKWYVKHRTIKVYFILIFLTIWVIVFPKSKLYRKIFADLPEEINSEK